MHFYQSVVQEFLDSVHSRFARMNFVRNDISLEHSYSFFFFIYSPLIPSRPLRFVEILAETFSIFVKIFTRFAPLYLLLIVPGLALLVAGSGELSSSVLTAARHDINFNDSDLTVLRNDFNAKFIGPNPFLMQQIQMSDSAASHATTSRLVTYVKAHAQDYSWPALLFVFGCTLLMFGLFVVSALAVDLASQAFEERPLEVLPALKASLARHVWKVIALYILYVLFFWTIDLIISIIPGTVGDFLASIMLGAQLYLIVRLVVTVPALVSEELSPVAAVTRSLQLTHRSNWRIIGISVIATFLLFIGVMLFGTILSLAIPNVATWWTDILTREHITINWFLDTFPAFLRSASIELTLTMMISLGFLAVFGTVLYYDLRTRTDGPLVYLEE